MLSDLRIIHLRFRMTKWPMVDCQVATKAFDVCRLGARWILYCLADGFVRRRIARTFAIKLVARAQMEIHRF